MPGKEDCLGCKIISTGASLGGGSYFLFQGYKTRVRSQRVVCGLLGVGLMGMGLNILLK